ncbi:MAG: hypothetical protein U0894_09065 [Pirellulales bacterium]
MIGYLANCPKCAFRFVGGHSHHTGSSEAVCDTCHCFFRCQTNNRWGPKVGEIITVYKVEGSDEEAKLIPTGLQFQVVESEAGIDSGQDFVSVLYPQKGLGCTECERGTIRFGFKEGEHCPWCSQAELEFSTIIY